MHLSRLCSDKRRSLGESGAAALEFIVAGAILLAPIVYLIVALGQIQSAALGTQAAARHVARAIATAPDAATADARAQAIVSAVGSEYGMDAADIRLDVRCPGSDVCPAAGETISVTVRGDVPLPLMPPVLGLDHLAVPVEADAFHRVSRVWGTSS